MFIILVFFISYIIYLAYFQSTINISTYYCFDKKMGTSNNTELIPTVFKKAGLIPVKSLDKADIIFTYNHDQFHHLSSKYGTKAKFLYGLRCVNLMASKSTLAIIADKRILPKTWILNVKKDLTDLETKFNEKKPLIIKGNVQRQNGLKIVEDIHDITTEYVVCQEIVKNPLLVANRRIAIRIYILIVCLENSHKFFIYNDGFIYYTLEEFSATLFTKNNTITSGYIDRKIYEDNPLTLQDLYAKLSSSKMTLLKENINKCFHCLHTSYKNHIQNNDVNDGVNRFIILGADVIPKDDYDVKLLEINKGPDLGFKDARDEELKSNLVKDAIQVIKNDTNKNFIAT